MLQSTKLSDAWEQPKLKFVASCICGHRYCTSEWRMIQPPSGGIMCRNLCTILGTLIPEKGNKNMGMWKKKAIKIIKQLESLIYEETLKE